MCLVSVNTLPRQAKLNMELDEEITFVSKLNSTRKVLTPSGPKIIRQG
jgi:hypothetical protein